MSGLPFPLPGDLLNPGMEPTSPASPALQADSFLTEPQGTTDNHVTQKVPGRAEWSRPLDHTPAEARPLLCPSPPRCLPWAGPSQTRIWSPLNSRRTPQPLSLRAPPRPPSADGIPVSLWALRWSVGAPSRFLWPFLTGSSRVPYEQACGNG